MVSLVLSLLLLPAADLPAERTDDPEPFEQLVLDEPRPTSDPLPIKAEALCARGNHYLESGDRRALLEARKLFEAVVRFYPEAPCGHAGVSRALGSLYLRLVEQDDAIIDRSLESARRAVELAPASAPAHAALASATLLALEPEDALARAEEALRLDPGSISALQTAAVVRMALGDVMAARQAIEEAIRIRPDLPGSYHIRGNVNLMNGEEGLAMRDYNIALGLDSDSLPTTLQLASTLEQVGNIPAAGRIFERVLREHPDDAARAYFIMGHSLMKRYSWNAALNAFEKATFETRKGFSNGTILYLQGICYEQLGRIEEAQAAFREVIDEYPDATAGYASPDRLAFPAYEALSRLSLASNRNDEAVDVLEEGIARPDASLDLFIRLARLYENYRFAEQAAAVLEKAVGREFTRRWAGRQMTAYVLWARVARHQEDQEGLARLAEGLQARAGQLEAIGDYVHYVDAVRALSIAGRPDLALEWLDRAVSAGYEQLEWMARDPELRSVTARQEFAALVAAIADKRPND